MRTLFDLLFACSHPRLTFPLTPGTRSTYRACLDCGAEFAYDWQAMRTGARIERRDAGAANGVDLRLMEAKEL